MASWRTKAACRDQPIEKFMINPRGNYDEGRAVCYRCDVRCECLTFALENTVDCNLYGGLSPRQRERLHGRQC